MTTSPSRFVWFDLMTPAPEAAIAFYRSVIGWGEQDWEGEQPYTMFTTGGEPIGGVMSLPDEAKEQGAPPHWLAYLEVDDVDARAEQVASAGGRIMVPGTDIPEVGRFAIVADPQGAVFALFEGEGEMEAPRGPGHFTWHELMTPDPDAAWSFYRDLAGWKPTSAMDMGEMGTYQMFGLDTDNSMGGIYAPPSEGIPPHWLHYVTVEDLDAAVQAVRDGGGQITNGPMEVPGGDRVAMAMDPQGAAFALHASPKG